MYRFILNSTVFLILSIFYTGCSSCSDSGKQELARQHEQEKARQGQPQRKEPAEETMEVPKPSNGGTTGKFDLAALYETCKKAVFLVYTSDHQKTFQGSGFFINASGVGVSNYHVFEDTQQGQEKIYLGDGQVYHIKRVLHKSRQYDYIVFQVDVPFSTPYLEIASNNPPVGKDVFTIGNPQGLQQTLSKGIVSGYRKGHKLIQTTTEITHGSSGGPLMNMKGQVVGITTSGLGEANLNFAVNINLLNINE